MTDPVNIVVNDVHGVFPRFVLSDDDPLENYSGDGADNARCQAREGDSRDKSSRACPEAVVQPFGEERQEGEDNRPWK